MFPGSELVGHIKRRGLPTGAAEEMLATMERLLTTFQADLARLSNQHDT